MLRWGDARAGARQVGRAPVWGRPRNKGGPVAAQPCCLLEHKQHSPKSVSGRYPGDTRVNGSDCGQRAGKPATNTECAHCPGPHMCPRGHPHVTLQYTCAKHAQGMCVYASHICLCMEYTSTGNRAPMCEGNVHKAAPLWIHACGTCGNTPLCYVHAALLSSSSHPSLGQPQNPSHSSRTDSQSPALLSRVKFFFFFAILCGLCEGNSNPLQYSCLENPMDRGAWQAKVHWVTKGRTQLKRLSAHTHTHTHVACGILVPQPGIKPAPLAVKVRSPTHWTARGSLRVKSSSVLLSVVPFSFNTEIFHPPTQQP